MKPLLALLLGLVFALAGSAAAWHVLDGTSVLRDALSFPATGAVAIVCIVILGWAAKALKFQVLAARLDRRLSFAHSMAVSIGCDFAFVASPGGVAGYPATILLFARVGVDAPRALTVASADQVLDLAFFAVAMPLALVWLLIHDLLPGPVMDICAIAAVTAGAVLVAISAVSFGGKAVSKLVPRWSRPGWTKPCQWVRGHWRQIRSHLRDLRAAPPAAIAGIAFATAAQWLARYATLEIALAWTGYDVPCAAVFLAQAAGLHAGQWTGMPGGGGATDAILFESLRHWLPFAPLATALIVWRLATFHLTLLAGGSACAWLAVRGRSASANYHCSDDMPELTR